MCDFHTYFKVHFSNSLDEKKKPSLHIDVDAIKLDKMNIFNGVKKNYGMNEKNVYLKEIIANN